MSEKVIYRPSRMMRDVYSNAKFAKFRLLDGAVRSGKSFVANDVALREIQKLPACNVLVSGYTISSVARNVIAEWKEMIDPNSKGLMRIVKEGKDDFLKINWRGLRNKKFYIRGAGKEHDHKQIQGSTFGYWLADEVVRHRESFVDMAMTRLSPPFAKSIWTMNPDSPFHFVKERFLDNPELYISDSKGFSLYRRWTFYLRDNPSLTKDYIDSLKRLYSGVFYKRYIKSLWVIAEGAIYDFFDTDEHCIVRCPDAQHHVVGIDYGTGNPTCFGLFGVNPKTKPKIWLEREYYYDSKRESKQKTDMEFAEDFRLWLGGTTPHQIIIDPSAASFKLQLRNNGFYQTLDADNSVIDGIRTQARMLKSGEYAIHEDCKQNILDYDAYVWDDKAQLKGEDKPIKQHDHTKDRERYVLQTLYGQDTLDLEELVNA